MHESDRASKSRAMTTELATVGSKGRVTIPKAIRDALGIQKQDRALFILEDGRGVLTPLRHRPLRELKGALPPTRADEGLQAIREEIHRDLGARLVRGGEQDAPGTTHAEC